MSRLLLDGGRPVHVAAESDRIGRGPWARLLVTAVVADEGSARAERGRILARTGHVHSVAVEPGKLSARVIGSGQAEYDAQLAAEPIPARVWAAVRSAARSKPQLADALRGSAQSVQLEHELLVDWGAPLVPPGRAIRRACTCPDADMVGTCKHLIALAYVLADAVDHDPSLLLRWRGVGPAAAATGTGPAEPALPPAPDAWVAGAIPVLRPARALPPGVVLKRLGRSGILVGDADLADVLRPAYAAFSASRHA